MRLTPEAFFVDEIPITSPSGEGQHLLLQIEKRGTNTEWLARQLARFVEIEPVGVGFAGLKDRHAVTRQWFSIDLAGRSAPDWALFNNDEYRVLQSFTHSRKLRRGELLGNRFVLLLNSVEGEREWLETRLGEIAATGVPNYFGNQRFGREGDNHLQALRIFRKQLRIKNRHKRGLYYSAARSLLFNLVLSERVSRGDWNRPLDGEEMPTGPMWGRGRGTVTGEVAELEGKLLADFADYCDGMEHCGLTMDRRPLVLQPEGLSWKWCGEGQLQLSFALPAGGYATTLLRELMNVTEPEMEESAQHTATSTV